MDENAGTEKHPGGRPTCFREAYIDQAYKLTLLGAIDKDLANFFDVCEDTIYAWKHDFPEFSEAIKKGKEYADSHVAERLYERARGYTHPEEKIFCHEGEVIRVDTIRHYPPDTAAIAFWLKNRRPKDWRDTHDWTSGGEKITSTINIITPGGGVNAVGPEVDG